MHSRLFTLFIGLIATFAAASPALAQAATINAASCSQANVQTAINTAATGDTVSVPSGTCSWSSPVPLPASKDLVIQGAGIGSTNLTCSSGLCFKINLAASHRITGFTMQGPGGLISTQNKQ